MPPLKRKSVEFDLGDKYNEPDIPDTPRLTISRKRKDSHTTIHVPYLAGPYKQLNKIGKGSHSIVYKVTHPTSDATLALKKLPINDYKLKTNRRSTILKEIEIHKLVNGHKNIISMIDHFEIDATMYMVLELCGAGSLYDIICRSKRSLREWEAKRLMIQLCGAVDWIHEKNIVHADLKLSNILIDSSNNLQLCDFGHSFVSTDIDNNSINKFGTPNYLSPEIISNFILSDKKDLYFPKESDIWSIGIVLYAMIFDKTPFEATTLRSTYENIVECKYGFVENKRVSNKVKKLIQNILKIQPLERKTIVEIVSDDWFHTSYFPDEINLRENNSDLNSMFENELSTVSRYYSLTNYINCLIDAGLKKYLITPGNHNKNLQKKERRFMEGTHGVTKSKKYGKFDRQLKCLQDLSALKQLERLGKLSSNYFKILNSTSLNVEKANEILRDQCYFSLLSLNEAAYITELTQQRMPSRDSISTLKAPIMVSTIHQEENGVIRYQLSNQDIGSIYPNSHSLLRVKEEDAFWYICPDNEKGWISKYFDKAKIPKEFIELLTEVEQFGSKISNVSSNLPFITKSSTTEADIFLRKYTKFENFELFELSNALQFNFEDSGSIISIHENGQLISFNTMSNNEVLTMPLSAFYGSSEYNILADKINIIKCCLQIRTTMSES
ncbi:hypothetical protein KAFR_0A05090 [Kazachstania africana CBS 2517]|uniref:Protein kinase domain-containing protein n=1 Tax=Kazachstania africana (strain ATCC 22294 / BCRC 22015 / CBS 2517 / CECT 1963 / NBRC 1671 / NRRL Y-8276) TaxID=1071382 RepID=H2ANJ5_KAZAF|nr:hypothetical protein KAFR_0A05090 [Kazachstania africana CBS 2517]CCF55945.1 hypothetical protein KAFR_0A05090 [Kazachstania africana CBS 2517]